MTLTIIDNFSQTKIKDEHVDHKQTFISIINPSFGLKKSVCRINHFKYFIFLVFEFSVSSFLYSTRLPLYAYFES